VTDVNWRDGYHYERDDTRTVWWVWYTPPQPAIDVELRRDLVGLLRNSADLHLVIDYHRKEILKVGSNE
jgi:hypothetical protein